MRRVINATEQLVAGTLYKIAGEFAFPDGRTVICITEIYVVPWLNKEEYSMLCENDQAYPSRVKRSLFYDSHLEADEIVPNEGALELERQFVDFESKFNRNYRNTRERDFRKRIFEANLAKIAQLNLQEQGTANYGVTQFADKTEAEFERYKGLRPRANDVDTNEIPRPMADIPDKELPKSFDWRDRNVISKVNIV